MNSSRKHRLPATEPIAVPATELVAVPATEPVAESSGEDDQGGRPVQTSGTGRRLDLGQARAEVALQARLSDKQYGPVERYEHRPTTLTSTAAPSLTVPLTTAPRTRVRVARGSREPVEIVVFVGSGMRWCNFRIGGFEGELHGSRRRVGRSRAGLTTVWVAVTARAAREFDTAD